MTSLPPRRSLAALALVATALAALLLGNEPAAAAARQVPTTTTTTTTVAPTTTTIVPAPTTTVPDATPPAPPTVEQQFPGIDPDQLRAFFRYLAGPPVPGGSGFGRRIVYSNLAQRLWLVEADGSVARTYLVSGRRKLPGLGIHHVFAKARFATSGSVHMEYMVRFAHGRNLAIGFHTIPIRRNGSPLQTLAQLGTPRSHGCVRQNPIDAVQLWNWTSVGTAVVAIP